MSPRATALRKSLPMVGKAPELTLRTVRISLTDRCDLACIYCRPSRNDGYLAERLDGRGWGAMLEALVRAGVKTVRITGGEPLLHPQVVDIVRYIRALGISDIAMTTNGTQLEQLAGPLRRAGLRRLNVSLDSLDADRFARVTDGGKLEQVIAGIEAARAEEFDELKTNSVVLRGINDDELESQVMWAWERGILPRFIELMPLGAGAALGEDAAVRMPEMLARLDHLLEPGRAAADQGRGPARYLRSRRDPKLRVGFITGSSEPFCATCDRLRVASDGVLRPCLASNDGVDASALAEDEDAGGLADAIEDAWRRKPDPRTWKGCAEAATTAVSIRAIGG